MKKNIVIFFSLFLFGCNSIKPEHINYMQGQKIIALDELIKIRPDITYTHLSDSLKVRYIQSSISEDKDKIWWELDPIIHPKRFILSISYGKVHSRESFIIVDDMYIDEFVWGPIKHGYYKPLQKVSKTKITESVYGKVAVIAQSGHQNYYHWMIEILPKLALLQKSGVAYDYLYLPFNQSFIKETIELLGIVDKNKIITSKDNDCYIQADELVVPSALSAFGYSSNFVIDFLRNSFIPLAESNVCFNKFAKKIFISRRKATSRKIMNEDEVFALFEQHGFVRYNLEDLSILEQVALFHHAECIVGEHGAGLTNIIFAQPNTKVIEIFQARQRMMFWYLGQDLKLEYTCLKTIPFDVHKNGNVYSVIPLDPIKNVITKIFES